MNIEKLVVGLLVASATAMGTDLASADEPGATLDLRYRIESVAEDAFDEDALAATLRTRLGYLSPAYSGWTAYLEFEDVHTAGADDYNSTANGKTNYPVIADPEDAELNEAWLAHAVAGGRATFGRQQIDLANQRFFGSVGFRQNEQTFDAVRLAIPVADGSFNVAWIERVNRIFGAHHPDPARANIDGEIGVFDYERKMGDISLAAYAHLIALDDAPLNSHRNLGVRAGGKRGDFDWRLEYATQQDYEDGLDSIDAAYWRADAGYTIRTTRIGVLHEVLGGDGTYAFQTPFATLHAFNGAADKFLVTPVNGLVDTALTLSTSAGKWKLGAAWHWFSADATSADYGRELDLQATRRFGDHWDIGLKLADYAADTFSTDTRKIWLTLHAAF